MPPPGSFGTPFQTCRKTTAGMSARSIGSRYQLRTAQIIAEARCRARAIGFGKSLAVIPALDVATLRPEPLGRVLDSGIACRCFAHFRQFVSRLAGGARLDKETCRSRPIRHPFSSLPDSWPLSALWLETQEAREWSGHRASE